MNNSVNLLCADVPACILCGAAGNLFQNDLQDPDRKIAGKWRHQICSNDQCQSVWLSPRPLESELIKAYANYHTHSKSGNSVFHKFFLSGTKRIIKSLLFPARLMLGLHQDARRLKYMGLKDLPPGKLLEVGVGGGRFLARMKKLDWDVSGIDYDPNAASRIQEKYGINVHVGDLTQLDFPSNSFDVIAMGQTVEHLSNPVAVFNQCFQLLKPGGWLVVTTPNIESLGKAVFKEYWRGWEPPRHLHLYSAASLKALAFFASFSVKEIKTYACDSATGYYSSCLNFAFYNSQEMSVWMLAKAMVWSYWMELKEAAINRRTGKAGQGIFMIALKPI